MATDTESVLERLLRESARGDTGSFKELYEFLSNRVFAYVRSRTLARDDALDITQQVFIELWKALPRFTYRSDATFYGFLFTIAKRQLIRTYRDARNAAVPLEREEDVPDAGEDRVLEDTLVRALASLDDISREIVVLHHWSRHTFGEIAPMLDMNESAVRVRHHRALGTLRTILGDTEEI
jgi:RNA polymerase sigma-70 factor (ECF subfamily)